MELQTGGIVPESSPNAAYTETKEVILWHIAKVDKLDEEHRFATLKSDV